MKAGLNMKLKEFLNETVDNRQRLDEGIAKSYTVRHFTETLDMFFRTGVSQNTMKTFVTSWLEREVDGI